MRFQILYRLYGQLPELLSSATKDNIQKYLSIGWNATYDVSEILRALDEISLDSINEFCDMVNETEALSIPVDEKDAKIWQDKYSKITNLHTQLEEFSTTWLQGFKSAYATYKECLTLMLASSDLQNPSVTQGCNNEILPALRLPTPMKMLDHHYFFQLIRVQMFGPSMNELFPMPLFDKTQAYQIQTYLEELFHLIQIITLISRKIGLPHNIFKSIPLSSTINKKVKEFFGKPIPQNMYSRLLE